MLATGGLVDTGKPVAMPQGHKKPSSPVSINQLSGTFKKGGRVKHYNQGALVVPAPKGAISNFERDVLASPAAKSATVQRERITTTAPTEAERQRMRQQVEEQRASEMENKGFERFKREILPSQMGRALPNRKGGKVC